MSNTEKTQKVKILVADDDPRQLPYIIASLIECNNETISLKNRLEIVTQCFDLKFTHFFLEVEKMINNKKNPFIPHIALLDVNFEKNATLLKKEGVDLRYKGIELAELIKRKANGFSKVILNTGFSDYEQWKEMFKQKGYLVKSEYSEKDPENTIYRKEKRGDKATDALTHLIRPILNHFAVRTYQNLDGQSKRKITLITDNINSRHLSKKQADDMLHPLPVISNNERYILGDLFYFNAEIVKEDGLVKISHSGLSDILPEFIADAKVKVPGSFPYLNGPWKTEAIQQSFSEYINVDKPVKLKYLEDEVCKLVLGFFIPVFSNNKVKFENHGFQRKYTLDTFQNEPLKIGKNSSRFEEAMKKNVVVRISAVLVAHLCTEQRLYLTLSQKIEALRLHKRAFKKYIDQNPPYIKFSPDDHDEEHKHVRSFITARLGLSYNEKEEGYQVNDLCDPERHVYLRCHSVIAEEIAKIANSR